jgi:hypothetical protein
MRDTPARFGPKSVLFWLAALVAAGIILIGARYIADPEAGGLGYGVPAPGETGAAYGAIKGARDVVAGLLIVAFLWMGDRRAVGVILLIATLIPVIDGLIVLRYSATPSAFIGIHWGTAVYMLVVAVMILRRSRS